MAGVADEVAVGQQALLERDLDVVVGHREEAGEEGEMCNPKPVEKEVGPRV